MVTVTVRDQCLVGPPDAHKSSGAIHVVGREPCSSEKVWDFSVSTVFQNKDSNQLQGLPELIVSLTAVAAALGSGQQG